MLIEERTEQRLLIVTLNRPEAANAINTEMANALSALAARVEKSPCLDAVILTGQGRHFCSGGDIAAFGHALTQSQDGTALANLLSTLATTVHSALDRLVKAGPLLVAAINGSATGAGLGMLCACDLIYAKPGVKLRAGFSQLGLSPDTGTTWFLPRRVGRHRALALLLNKAPISVERALAIGLVDELLYGESALFLDKVIARTHQLIASGKAVRHTRRLIHSSEQKTLSEHLQEEQSTLVNLATSPEVQAHLRAVLQSDLGKKQS
ncbi:enoyl-CoA hydratase/isomerase family protein [Sinimarinibacterium sp. NLF-5-8]|uniref:enoyl-CoA hydratase/isomerase family protein n=1 Tax=Sinimarinibacterium sp. NLF-5-8 TaxID=2698684 RepID=UPI00137C1FE1|nr:enoyl-CoA hydratase/isomerase family protein [Sinimarinibacterium sp. NLF-5-8]QHS10303.1 enoyl-CoA hydratase/isomerase family protein [Sinimarinibacterium sp. NLF-5-8]